MTDITKKGFSFSFNPDLCAECKGKCCKNTGKPSYLWITLAELSNIASFLNVSDSDFKKNYLRRENGLHNIKDIKIDGVYSCVFLDIQTGKCSIYEVRPNQCKEYPFWECYRKKHDTLYIECIAVRNNDLSI